MKKSVLYSQKAMLVAMLALGLLGLWTLSAFAAVALVNVTAEQIDGERSVQFEWQTATEDGTAVFYVVRVQGGPENVPESLEDLSPSEIDALAITILFENSAAKQIPARGTTSTGFTYTTIDEDVVIDTTYSYILVEIEANNNVVPQEDFIRTVEVVDPDADGGGGSGIGGGDPTPEPDEETPTPEVTETPDPDETTPTPEPEEEVTPTPEVTETPEGDEEEETPPEDDAEATATAEAEATATAEAEATEVAEDEEDAPEEAEPTATPEPTNTPQPTPTQTPPPTSTPRPTATLVVAPTRAPETDSGENRGGVEEVAAAPSSSEDDSAEFTTQSANDPTGETVDLDDDGDTGSLLAAPVAEAAEDDGYPVIEEAVEIVEVEQPVAVQGDAYPVADEAVAVEEVAVSAETNTTAFGEAADIAADSNNVNSSGTVIGSNNTSTIGGNSSSAAATNQLPPPAQAEPERSGPSLLLWLAFGAGILIFGGGIIGSILIFTRQREEE